MEQVPPLQSHEGASFVRFLYIDQRQALIHIFFHQLQVLNLYPIEDHLLKIIQKRLLILQYLGQLHALLNIVDTGCVFPHSYVKTALDIIHFLFHFLQLMRILVKLDYLLRQFKKLIGLKGHYIIVVAIFHLPMKNRKVFIDNRIILFQIFNLILIRFHHIMALLFVVTRHWKIPKIFLPLSL